MMTCEQILVASMKAIVRPVHKTCPSWGVTVCGLQLYQRRPPKTAERWDRGVTCTKCLSQSPNTEGESRAASARTLHPLVGSLDGDK